MIAPRQAGLAALLLALLAGCAEREVILPGQRYDVRTPLEASLPDGTPAGAAQPLVPADPGPQPNRVQAVSLGPQQSPANWPQRGFTPTHRLPHLALRATPQPIWVAEIGQGNDRRHRIAADPVSDGARIFTLDSRARVTATSTSGATLWSADLTPPGEGGDDGSGGGLAVAGGRLYATTGFGTLSALDPATGRVIWTQKLGAVGNASPTVAGNLVYVIGRDNRAWAVRPEDGKVEWALSGTPVPSGYVGGGGVAVDDRIALLPFASGELTAVLRNSGVRTWGIQVAGQRRGQAYAGITDLAADPVLIGNTVYAANASGRLIAADAGNGERIWTATEGALASPVLAGGSLFLVSDNAEVVRLDASDGTRIWGTPLPDFVEAGNPRKRKTRFAHFGPLLAGGRVVIASTDGVLRQFDPASGALVGQVALPAPAASNPIVVGGTLYLVTADGRLVALR